ncbi:hypothetical protein QBC34DRAFT_333410 [Podospora aff. communis PSN243]|uniref:Protein kinase domain-containing protein n=1 Tax=Podospora aff. communis PSN243 TaxID=3040156 RepID=A0AAV9GA08_9PEZI|nr:hypothetical protein QBC34DRAFT_333410 [Podospora aff. communis PSN243]
MTIPIAGEASTPGGNLAAAERGLLGSDNGYDDDEEPISAMVTACELTLERALNSTEHVDILRKLRAKFVDWAAYLGVFAVKSVSLDHRLKRHQQYRDLVLLVLDTLNNSILQILLTDASGSDSDSSSDDDVDHQLVALASIEKSIKELERLAISIRQASTSSLDARVKAFGARKLAEVAPFEALATLAVNSLYPDAPDVLLQRLSKSMTQRYTRLLYWRSHDKKLRADRRRQGKLVQVDDTTQSKVDNTPSGSVIEDSQHQRQSASVGSGRDNPEASTRNRATSMLSGTVLSNTASHLPPLPQTGLMVPRPRRSTATTIIDTSAKFPAPPRIVDGEDQKPCPFCRKNISKDDFMDLGWWRKHVNSDLFPFICVSNSCSASPVFASRSEWIIHMERDHGDSTSWRSDRCPICLFLPSKPGHVRIDSQPPTAAAAEALRTGGRQGDLPPSFAKIHKPSENSSNPKSVHFDVTDHEHDSESILQRSSQPPGPTGITDAGHSGTRIAANTAMLNHIADHLQFLALLTPRLLSEKLTDGDIQDFSSSIVTSNEGPPGDRSTLDNDDLDLPGESQSHVPQEYLVARLSSLLSSLDQILVTFPPESPIPGLFTRILPIKTNFEMIKTTLQSINIKVQTGDASVPIDSTADDQGILDELQRDLDTLISELQHPAWSFGQVQMDYLNDMLRTIVTKQSHLSAQLVQNNRVFQTQSDIGGPSTDPSGQNAQLSSNIAAAPPSHTSSFKLDSSEDSLIPVAEYLASADSDSFEWDSTGGETSEEWLKPVREAGLDSRKHKVFHHNNKEYLQQPRPFQLEHELGESRSTVVYRVRAPEGIPFQHPLALKVIVCKEATRPPGPDSNARRLALHDIQNMATVRHPHIVVYVASFEDYCVQTRRLDMARRRPRPTTKLTPLVSNHQFIKKHIMGIAMYPPGQCNLQVFMRECINHSSSGRSSPAFRDSEEERENAGWWKVPYLFTYFGCLAQAVAHLHRSNVRIRHNDIKPENVIIDQFGSPVLTDLGLSNHFEPNYHSEDVPAAKTPKYADPEALADRTRDERSDIFSLGCVFLEMATVIIGRLPQYAERHLATSKGHSDGYLDGFKYAEALEAIPGYMDELNRLANEGAKLTTDPYQRTRLEAVVKVLPVIMRMMDSDSSQRPSASELYPSFRHLYDVPGAPGPCSSCEEERRIGGSGERDRGKGLASRVAARMPAVIEKPRGDTWERTDRGSDGKANLISRSSESR